MLEKIVTLYRKAEMGAISFFADVNAGVVEETSFYDAGYMQTQISRIQKEIGLLSNKIQMRLEVKDSSDYEKRQMAILIEQRRELVFQMIFFASNSFKNLEDCVKMADGYDFAFMKCVNALQEYHVGNKENAFSLLENYYREYGSVEGHYLVNKVFGMMLVNKQNYQQAIPFLSYALQFIPDDIECLSSLCDCYKHVKEIEKENVVQEILQMLG